MIVLIITEIIIINIKEKKLNSRKKILQKAKSSMGYHNIFYFRMKIYYIKGISKDSKFIPKNVENRRKS